MHPVCLITPPSTFLLDERVFVSLGILRVAACLERDGIPVEHVDLSGIANFEEAIRDHASRSEARVFGLTATTPQMPATTRVVSVLREVRPDARIILGGPHITLVNAARKREVKLGKPGRAQRAFDRMAESIDVLVAGDGDDAIFPALASCAPKLIDADDPKSSLFLTDQRYEEIPFPARHLVDMDSYHYSIDGVRAHSMIAQLGCLAAGTRILKADGSEVPIETLCKGDRVACFNGHGQIVVAPIAATWSRDADDLWEIVLDDGATIYITSEHPIWTMEGWQAVIDIHPGSEVACLSSMPKENRAHYSKKRACSILQQAMLFRESPSEATRESYLSPMWTYIRNGLSQSQDSQILRPTMSGRMDEDELQSCMASVWSANNEGEMGRDDSGRTHIPLQYRNVKSSCENSARSADIVRDETWRSQSDEAPRGGREGISYNQGEMGRDHIRAKEEGLERRSNDLRVGAGCEHAGSQFTGTGIVYDSKSNRSDVSVRRESCLLDWPLCIGQASESRLYRQEAQEGNPASWGAVPFNRISSYRGEGLCFEGLERFDNLVQGIASKTTASSTCQDQRIYFQRVISKRFIGHSRVYNITVCPGHSYIANGIIVHNCPYSCGFCGGRESPMLRHIRTRTTQSIVAEVRHLYEHFGVPGIQLYDDEVNVNKECVGLMNAIAELGKHLGVEFRLRGFIKSNLFTDEQAEAMYRAGFRWILVGFESGSPRILENINKRATREQNNRCVEIARRHGLKVKALMSIGHPGESEETVRATRDWLLEQRPDDFDCTVISCYPGTPYYDHAEQTAADIWTYVYPRNGDRLHAYDVDYSVISDAYKGIPGEYRSYVFTDYLSADDLVRLRDDLEASVRAELGIPFNAGAPGVRYEASMGQLPGHILRRSSGAESDRARECA